MMALSAGVRKVRSGASFPRRRFRDDIHPRTSSTDKTRLPPAGFLGNVCRMSAVELAVKRVKKLSARQARELLGWLDGRQTNGKSSTRPRRKSRQSALVRRKQKFKEWHDSVRGTTDWEPPRLPDDLVKPFRL
jgi:hypothetical protein